MVQLIIGRKLTFRSEDLHQLEVAPPGTTHINTSNDIIRYTDKKNEERKNMGRD